MFALRKNHFVIAQFTNNEPHVRILVAGEMILKMWKKRTKESIKKNIINWDSESDLADVTSRIDDEMFQKANGTKFVFIGRVNRLLYFLPNKRVF